MCTQRPPNPSSALMQVSCNLSGRLLWASMMQPLENSETICNGSESGPGRMH